MPQPSTINPLELPFIELQTIDSTNNYARQQIYLAGLPESQHPIQHGTAWFAHEQVGGKGQRGKVWLSDKGSNIAISIAIKPAMFSFQLSAQFQLSACVAVSVHNFFKKYAGDNTKIKWPNDLYWQDRKAGGILIESVIRSRESEIANSYDTTKPATWEWAIIGIGINISQTFFSPHLPNPVSLKQITGKNFIPTMLAIELHKKIIHTLIDFSINGFENIYAEYQEILYKKNEFVKLKKDNRVFEACIKAVSPYGKLIVEHSLEEEFDFGEVEWLIK